MLRAWRCGMAFMRYLRVRDELLRSMRPDLVGHFVIPGAETSDEPGINPPADESMLARHRSARFTVWRSGSR
jgi:hypothetical protein